MSIVELKQGNVVLNTNDIWGATAFFNLRRYCFIGTRINNTYDIVQENLHIRSWLNKSDLEIMARNLQYDMCKQRRK